MGKDQLRDDLARLHQELSETPSLGEGERELLVEVLRDIEALLERDESGAEEHETLADRLNGAMDRFEDQHTSLTAAVGRIANALSNLGV